MSKIIKVFNSVSIFNILAISLLLRLILINQSFWLDEGSQAMTSLRPLKEIIFNNLNDFHPPLMYFLTHFWIQVSMSEQWLRLLPVIFGVATVYVGFLLAQKLLNKTSAKLFALLLSISPYHIYYSQEFRMYSLVTLLVMLSMYFFVNLFTHKTYKNIVGFVISSVLILYTHYLGGTIFIAQLLFIILYKKDLVKKFLLYYLIIGLLFLPWLPQLLTQLQMGVAADTYLPGWTQMLSLSFYKAVPLLLIKFTIGRIDLNNTVMYVSLILVAVSVIGASVYPLLKRFKDEKVMFVFFWFVVPVVLTFLISFKLPMFQPFRLLFCLPAFYLLIVLGLEHTKKYKHLVLSAVVLLFFLCQSIFWFNPVFWREDWKGAITSSDIFVSERGTVLFAWVEPFPPYSFYSQSKKGLGVVVKNPSEYEAIDQRLLGISLGNKVVYYSYLSQLTDPDKNIEKWLELHNYKLIETKNYNGVGFVYYFVSPDQLIGVSSE